MALLKDYPIFRQYQMSLTATSLSNENNNNNNNNSNNKDNKNNNNNTNNQQAGESNNNDDDNLEDLDEESLLIEKLLLEGVDESLLLDGYYGSPSSTSSAQQIPSTNSLSISNKTWLDSPELNNLDIPDRELHQYIKSPAEVKAWTELMSQITFTSPHLGGSKHKPYPEIAEKKSNKKRKLFLFLLFDHQSKNPILVFFCFFTIIESFFSRC